MKTKKLLAVLSLGLGIGLSTTAMAFPDAQTCELWLQACNDGLLQQCQWYASWCGLDM